MNEEVNQSIPKKVNIKLLILLSITILIIAILIIFFNKDNNSIKTDNNSSSSTIDNKSSSSDEESINYENYYFSYALTSEKLGNKKIKIDRYDNCVLNIDSKLYISINDNSIINVLENSSKFINIESCNDIQEAINNKTVLLEKMEYSINNESQIEKDFYSNTSPAFNLESALSLLKNVDNSIYGADDYYIDSDTMEYLEKNPYISYKNYYLYNNLLFGLNNSHLKSNICYKRSTFENILKYYYGNQLDLSKKILSYYNGYCETQHYIIYDELNDCYVHEQPEIGAGCETKKNYILKVNSFKKINNQYILKANVFFYKKHDEGNEELLFAENCDYGDITCSAYFYSEQDNLLLDENEFIELFDDSYNINTNSVAYNKIISDSRLKEYSYVFEENDGYYYYKGAVEN